MRIAKNKISDDELKKLLKKHSAKRIIYMHIENKITLNSKQLNKVLKIKKDEEERI